MASSSVAQVDDIQVYSEILFLQTDCNLFMVGPVLAVMRVIYHPPEPFFFTRVELNNILKLDNCQFYYYVTIAIFLRRYNTSMYTYNMSSSGIYDYIYSANSKNRIM
jgi:hypothetical protein